jgi:hypothetical protein
MQNMQAIFLAIIADSVMQFFAFDSSGFDLRKTVFKFYLVQTVTEI